MTAFDQMQYAVVGALLKDPNLVGETLTKLHPSDFRCMGARGLYEAIGSLHFEGAPINQYTILDRAGEDYRDALVEAFQYASGDAEYYIGQVQEKSRLCSLKSVAEQIASADDLDAADRLISKMNELCAERSRIEILNASDAARDFVNSQAAPPPKYFEWGMAELDRKLYVEKGDYVVVGGFPSAGKTLLSMQFAKTLADTYRVGYFSFETSPKKLVDRMMAHIGRIPLSAIKNHKLTEEQWGAAAMAATVLAQKKLEFVPAAGLSVRDMKALALSRRYDVIFVDYLQIVATKASSRYEEVTNISKDLHTLAQANGITVIALAQLSRPDKTVDGKMRPPSMSSFRESGQIEQDADVALLLWPSDPNDNRSTRMLKCGKNKDGERFILELAFDGAMQTMMPLETRKDVPDWVRAAEEAPPVEMEGFTYG